MNQAFDFMDIGKLAVETETNCTHTEPFNGGACSDCIKSAMEKVYIQGKKDQLEYDKTVDKMTDNKDYFPFTPKDWPT